MNRHICRFNKSEIMMTITNYSHIYGRVMQAPPPTSNKLYFFGGEVLAKKDPCKV